MPNMNLVEVSPAHYPPGVGDSSLTALLCPFPQAKKFVESCPQTLKENLPKEEADKLKKTLEALGATVSLE